MENTYPEQADITLLKQYSKAKMISRNPRENPEYKCAGSFTTTGVFATVIRMHVRQNDSD